MHNLKMVVEYDGRGYHGWQRQKGQTTVQQVLEESIGRITGENVRVIGSGRTDAGVHALKQTAHFKTASPLAVQNLQRAINSYLPADIVVKELTEVAQPFHARFDVQSKVYMYQIFHAPIRSVQYRHLAWHVRPPLDLSAMERGLACLKGRHDFSSFCGKREVNRDCVRDLKEARLERTSPELIRIYLEADGFLRYMVRAIVGTLVEVGKGKRKPEELSDILAARERKSAGITAPPQGLFLVDVKY